MTPGGRPPAPYRPRPAAFDEPPAKAKSIDLVAEVLEAPVPPAAPEPCCDANVVADDLHDEACPKAPPPAPAPPKARWRACAACPTCREVAGEPQPVRSNDDPGHPQGCELCGDRRCPDAPR